MSRIGRSRSTARRAVRMLGVASAALLVVAACTNRWLDHDDEHLGLLGLRAHDTLWIWHARWIEVARQMNEPIARMVAFTGAGIATAVASCVAALALLAGSLRAARWTRPLALGAVGVAMAASAVFLVTKPELDDPVISRSLIGAASRYALSWSLIAFWAGAIAAIIYLRLSPTRSRSC